VTLIRPLAKHGAETWTMNRAVAKWLATLESKVLKEMFGGN
jgi:hypothetical protein